MARVSSSAGGLFGFGQHPEGWPIGFPALTFSVPSWQELVLFAKYDVERAVWLEIDCLFIYFLLLIPNLDVSKNGGFPPQIIHFNRVFNYKPSILGYLYFWKHPIVFCCSHGCFLERLELFCFDVLLGCFFFPAFWYPCWDVFIFYSIFVGMENLTRIFFMCSRCFSLFLCSMMNGELKLFANFPLPC